MNSKRTFRGSCPCYAITFFFFCFSTGVFSQVLSIYLAGIGKTTTVATALLLCIFLKVKNTESEFF